MNKKRLDTSVLAKSAFLIALSVVLTRYMSILIPIAGAQGIRVGFGSIPINLSGILFGPVIGGLTGLGADVLGVLISPQGTFHPGFMLSSVLTGVIPGLVFLAARKRNPGEFRIKVASVFIGQLLVAIVVSLLLNTFWLSQLFGNAFIVLLPPRALNAAVNVPIQTFIIYNLADKLRRHV